MNNCQVFARVAAHHGAALFRAHHGPAGRQRPALLPPLDPPLLQEGVPRAQRAGLVGGLLEQLPDRLFPPLHNRWAQHDTKMKKK